MKHVYGIVLTEANTYLMAVCKQKNSGEWYVSSFREWESGNPLKNHLLLTKGIYFGISSCWSPKNSEVINSGSDMIVAESSKTNLSFKHHFNIISNTTHIDVHSENLNNNILGIVPEDSYTTTIPLFLSQVGLDTFLSVYGNGKFYTFGVTIERRLAAVFRLAPCKPDMVSSHLRRIKGYWNIHFPDILFPKNMVTFTEDTYTPDESFPRKPHRICHTFNNEYEMKAVGVALSKFDNTVPIFKGESPQARFRKKRTFLYGLSIVLLLCTLVLSTVTYGIDFWFKKKISEYENEYQKVIVHNDEIKKLLNRSNDLAETIIRLEKTFSRQTIWGKFFYELGKERPKGLFFERFGTKPIKGGERIVEVAISGWSPKEASVTDFIGKLQKLPYITQITLASLERNKQKKKIFGFKILCTILLNEQS